MTSPDGYNQAADFDCKRLPMSPCISRRFIMNGFAESSGRYRLQSVAGRGSFQHTQPTASPKGDEIT